LLEKDRDKYLFNHKLLVRIVQGRFNALMDLVHKNQSTYAFKSGCDDLKYGDRFRQVTKLYENLKSFEKQKKEGKGISMAKKKEELDAADRIRVASMQGMKKRDPITIVDEDDGLLKKPRAPKDV
jgi:hypothetical protein